MCLLVRDPSFFPTSAARARACHVRALPPGRPSPSVGRAQRAVFVLFLGAPHRPWRGCGRATISLLPGLPSSSMSRAHAQSNRYSPCRFSLFVETAQRAELLFLSAPLAVRGEGAERVVHRPGRPSPSVARAQRGAEALLWRPSLSVAREQRAAFVFSSAPLAVDGEGAARGIRLP